jgi:hypothetical protein
MAVRVAVRILWLSEQFPEVEINGKTTRSLRAASSNPLTILKQTVSESIHGTTHGDRQSRLDRSNQKLIPDSKKDSKTDSKKDSTTDSKKDSI